MIGGNSVIIASMQAGCNSFLCGRKTLTIVIEQLGQNEQPNICFLKKTLISRGDIIVEPFKKKGQRQNFNVAVLKKLISSVLCRVLKRVFMKYRQFGEELLYRLEYMNNQLEHCVNRRGRIRNIYEQLAYQLRLSVIAIKCTVKSLMNKRKIKASCLFSNNHNRIRYYTIVDKVKKLYLNIEMYIVNSKKKILESGRVSFGKKECFAKSKSKAIKVWDILAV